MRRNSHFGENIVASAVQKPFVGLAKARVCEACKGLFLVGFNMYQLQLFVLNPGVLLIGFTDSWMRQSRHLAASSLWQPFCNDLLTQFVSCGQDIDDLYSSSVLKSSH